MDFRRSGPGAFAFGVAWRSLMAAGLAFLLLHILTTTQYYATAVVLAGIIGFIVLDSTQLYAPFFAPPLADTRNEYRERARQLDQMTALLDAVTVALFALTPEGEITFANRAARLLAGEEVGRLEDVAALGPGAAAAIRALPAGARQIVTMADGRAMLVWVSGFSAPGMTAQKLISLQAVVGELDAVQLKAWQDMTRVLSHEMMNSLTPISSLSESLATLLRDGRSQTVDGKPGGDVAEAVETIGRRSQHLIEFVERYRKIAELPPPILRTIALKPFLGDIDALMQAQLGERGIAYRSSLSPKDLSLNADPQLLSQALINLLHNAADAAASASSPLVILSCAREEADIVFSVSDNGAGVSEERLQEIFVPFFTTKPGGHGIGLTLARQIALAHRGQIGVRENHPTGGAIFRMSIPMGVFN
jgi:two-component system nitrogen regulation sensor histidine kinase NtrY